MNLIKLSFPERLLKYFKAQVPPQQLFGSQQCQLIILTLNVKKNCTFNSKFGTRLVGEKEAQQLFFQACIHCNFFIVVIWVFYCNQITSLEFNTLCELHIFEKTFGTPITSEMIEQCLLVQFKSLVLTINCFSSI